MADAESSRKKMVFIGGIPHAACCRRDLLCRAACCHRLDGQVVEDGGCKAFMGRSRAIRVPNFEASDILLSEKRGQCGRPPGRQSGNPRGRPVRSCKNIAEIAGLTDESVCPTVGAPDRAFLWGRRFRLPTNSFTASHPLGSLLMPGSSGASISPLTSLRAPPDSM